MARFNCSLAMALSLITTDSRRLDLIALAIMVFLGLLLATKRQRSLCLPPGPPGLPIVGNARDMPTHHQWETFTRWAKKYGDLVYVNVLGQPIVIVNSAVVAHDLFDKRSSLYSDRCDFPMINDLMGGDWSFAFMRYGERWRRHRKVFHQKFHSMAVASYQPIQLEQTRGLLRRLHETPVNFAEHLRHHSGAIIMEVVYGIRVLPKDDPYLRIAEHALAGLEAGTPGTFLVDTLPILKYVPEWMPGAGFRKKARVWREYITQMCVVPFTAVKASLNSGTAKASFVSSLLEELSERPNALSDEEEIIRNTGGVAYGAGSDTTATALIWFILAMVLYPEVQRKAQSEIDAVVEMDRLPRFEDRENLPYVNALCKEVLRWHPVVPLGIAHRVTEDDVYRNYDISKGSIVLGNTWEILRNEKTYGPRPEEFDPERFLSYGVKAPTAAFGYGRRICPGRYLAVNSLFIAVVSILHQFDIKSPTDRHGEKITVEVSSTSGFFSCPEPFACNITPRSQRSERSLLSDD